MFSRFFIKRTSITLPLLTLSALMYTGFFLSGCEKKQAAPDVPALASNQPAPDKQIEIRVTPAQARSINLQTQMVERTTFITKIQTNGQIQAADYLEAHIFSPASGKDLTVPVTLGQTVHAGQVLATIKSDQINQLESDLLQQNLQSTSDIKQAQVQLRFSKVAYEREKYLYTKKVSAKADLDTAETQYEKDQANLQALQTKQRATVNAAQNRLSLYGAGPAAASQVISKQGMYPYFSITAPRSGVLIARNLNPGEQADTSREIFTVADLHSVWLIGNVYEKDVRNVQKGQPIDVTLDSYPGRIFEGRLNFISNILDPQTRTLQIRGQVTNPNLLLKPNMFARMSVQTGSDRLLAVPKSAVEQLGDASLVYVQRRPGIFIQRKVTTGQDNGSYVQILTGLSPGEIIATQGAPSLKGIMLKQTQGGD